MKQIRVYKNSDELKISTEARRTEMKNSGNHAEKILNSKILMCSKMPFQKYIPGMIGKN